MEKYALHYINVYFLFSHFYYPRLQDDGLFNIYFKKKVVPKKP